MTELGSTPAWSLPACIYSSLRASVFHLCDMGIINPTDPQIRLQIKSAHKDAKKLGPLNIDGGNVKRCSHRGKVRRFLKKLIMGLSQEPAIPLPALSPTELKSGPHTGMAQCSQQRYQQWPKRRSNPRAHQQMMENTVWSVQTMEYYSVLKRKEILPPTTT